MSKPKPRTVHFTLSTHWDREWRESFQGIRYALVALMDRVIAGLEDGRMAGPFQTDGQSILIEDYLEIRPDRREQVARLVREGRLIVGPWYSMPDEFTVSGEALIRNLLVGRQDARDLGGEPSISGYVPDMFGHCSQLPQIFAQCGILGGYLWRGINNTQARAFRWRGADGTELPCHKFGNIGYGTFAHQVGRGHEPYVRPEDDPPRLIALAREYFDQEAAATRVDSILLHDSCDHQEWNAKRYALLMEAFADDVKYTLVHSSLDAYLRELIAQRARIKDVLVGELRAPGTALPTADPIGYCSQWMIPGVLSSRVRLKQANAECQALLTQWAEPATAFAWSALGSEFAPGFLAAAWRSLMKNHAHDSIDGCSLDQVHKDMEYRFDQCRDIAEKLTVDATSRIAASVAGQIGADQLRVTVFNPRPHEFAGPIELELEIPTTWPTFNEFFGFEPKPGFVIADADGKEIPYQRLSQSLNHCRQRVRPLKFVEGVMSHHIGVALELLIPAAGYTTLTVSAVAAGRPIRHASTPSLVTSERSMANEFLDVTVASNGSITLTDLGNGARYERLLTFEDSADIGDGWYHGMAVNDAVFSSTASAAEVSVVHDGPLMATFRVRTTMTIPARWNQATMSRSGERAVMILASDVILRRGGRYLEVTTRVENTADDHRVRVLFPSGAKASTFLTDTAFDVVERPVALPADNHRHRELAVETQPQQHWTAVFDTKRGLAVVVDGLLETAVRDQPERPIALTLFRGTRRTIFTQGEPGGQMRGDLSFRFRVVPLSGPPDRAGLCRHGQEIAAKFRAVQLLAADLEIYRAARALPAVGGFLRIDGGAVASCIRQVGDVLEVRLWNPSTKKIGARVVLGPALAANVTTRAVRTDFEGNVSERIPMRGRSARIALGAKQIVTLRFG